MILLAESLPGSRDKILEDAYQVAVKTGATIRFAFNAESVDVDDTGTANFYGPDDPHWYTLVMRRRESLFGTVAWERLTSANEKPKA